MAALRLFGRCSGLPRVLTPRYMNFQRLPSRRLSEKHWPLRLAHENGYLSWTRNAAITTIAAAAFYNIEPLASAGADMNQCCLVLGLDSAFCRLIRPWERFLNRRYIALPVSNGSDKVGNF
jgi:hypothetical protein